MTDTGLAALASARHPRFCAQLTSLALNHVGASDAGRRTLLEVGPPELSLWLHCSCAAACFQLASRRALQVNLSAVSSIIFLLADQAGAVPRTVVAAQCTDPADLHTRCLCLQRCGELRALSLQGMLFNADVTMLCAAQHCR